MFYSSIGAEILRIGRVSSLTENFLISGKALINRVIKQGAKMHRIDRILKKIYGRQQTLRSFASNAAAFSNSLLI